MFMLLLDLHKLNNVEGERSPLWWLEHNMEPEVYSSNVFLISYIHLITLNPCYTEINCLLLFKPY